MTDHIFFLHDAVHILRSNGTSDHADACAWAVTEIERLNALLPKPTATDDVKGLIEEAREHPALDQLRNHQRQLDRDGIEVGVSRQAIDETLALIERLAAALSDADAEVRALREALEKIAAGTGVYGMQAGEYKQIARAALKEQTQ